MYLNYYLTPAPKNIDVETIKISASNPDYGILDSDTRGHFVTPKAPLTNIKTDLNPVKVTTPNRKCIVSTEVGNINWSLLPKEATTLKIIPEFKGKSLIAVKQLNDAGCTVILHLKYCIVFHNNKIMLHGIKCAETQLWVIPLNYMNNLQQKNDIIHQVNNVHNQNTRGASNIYSSVPFLPPVTTLVKALDNN